MNHESEKDMAQDVEENPELYQALADGDENAYKSMEVDKSGGVSEKEGLRMDEIHWWCIDSKIQYIRTTVSVHIMFLWASVFVSLISGMVGYWELGFVFIFIVVLSLSWQTLFDLQSMIDEREKYE